MAVAWFKRIFGGSDSSDHEAQREIVDKADPETANPSSTEKHAAVGYSHLNDEYLAELDRLFCHELFGGERLYSNSSDAQRSSARQLLKKLAQTEVKSDSIPRKPSTLPSLMKLLKRDDLSYAQISESLLKDPALTSQVLKTANSPFFRLSDKPVDSLEQATFIMGIGGIRKVVSAAILLPVFKSEEKVSAFTEAVWEWALSSGKAVDVLFQIRGESEGSTYLLGLLPALALLLICQELNRIEEGRPEEHKLLPIQKLDIFKRVGWKYCIAIRKEWGLPEQFDDYLYGLREENDADYSDALAAALLVAQYALVRAKNVVPISLVQLSEITGSTLQENQRMIEQLSGRIVNEGDSNS
jgi:HD-like signal output (HDOD) protein